MRRDLRVSQQNRRHAFPMSKRPGTNHRAHASRARRQRVALITERSDCGSHTTELGTPMPTMLVVVASEREGLGLIEDLGLKQDRSFRVAAGKHEQKLGLYRGVQCDLLITGVLEHHMVAATSLYLCQQRANRVVNFGAFGTYGTLFGERNAPRIGDVVSVSTSLRFDVDDNLHWVPARTLEEFDIGLESVVCATGSRYSRPSDYVTDCFPKTAHVEDMELYALAVLCETFGVPLHSIKYVTNEVGHDGREQFRKNVVSARDAGYRALISALDTI